MLVLGALVAGCSAGDTETRAPRRPIDEAAADVAKAGLTAGTYVVRSGRYFQGDTLLLAGLPDSYFARLAPARAGATTIGVYTGSVGAMVPALYPPNTTGPQVRFSLECYCQIGNTAFDRPRYANVALGGSYTVRELRDGSIELRQTDAVSDNGTDTADAFNGLDEIDRTADLGVVTLTRVATQ